MDSLFSSSWPALGLKHITQQSMAVDLPSLSDYLRALSAAAEVQIDPTKPLKLYLRSTELVFKQAAIYLGEGDLEKSYVLFMKFSNLVLDKLPKHPEFGSFQFDSQKSNLKELCRKAINKLESIRPRLENSYTESLEAEKRFKLADARKQEEIKILEEEAMKLKRLKAQHEMATSSAASVEVMNHLDVDKEPESFNSNSKYQLPQSTDTMISQNTVPQLASVTNESLKALRERMGLSTSVSTSTITKSDSKTGLGEPETKPTTKTSSVKYFSESGEPLRPVHIPQRLISSFLQLASENTRNNLETCAVIAGKLQHDEFTVTSLILPKQVATSDTCAMINEEEIISAQDSLDVMSLGWIHTHPTQKCFLSSVDLHTHMPFQLLMAEAIAIVCAPTQNPNFGVFRLTDPPGLELITKCQHPSAFHPHPQNVQIYRELKGPDSHAQLDPNLPLEVIDLRNK